jgi:hypothetical protein
VALAEAAVAGGARIAIGMQGERMPGKVEYAAEAILELMATDKTATLRQAIDAANKKLNAGTENLGESLGNEGGPPPMFVPVGDLSNLDKTLDQLTAE